MNFFDLVALSFQNLTLHKFRSVLTSLGIIFGVASVIAMLAISEGAKSEALKQIESMGIDQILLSSRRPPPSGKNTSDASNTSSIQKFGLTEVDRLHILRMDNVRSIATARNSRKAVLRGTTRLDLALCGVSIDFLEASRSFVVEGRWLSSADRDHNVCVIGNEAKRALFPLSKRHVIGEIVTVSNQVFRIVGVYENLRGTVLDGVGSPNNLICISQKASAALYGNAAPPADRNSNNATEVVDYDTFLVRVQDVSCIDDTAKRISGYLAKTHGENRDWQMVIPLEILRQREQTQNLFTVIMSSIAGISLLVGGIGIMNIMLANVYERRKEIGTRRALGAQKSDILFQFLLETMFQTLVGGGIGIALGIGIAFGVAWFAGWPVVFSSWAILLAIFFSAVTGIIFGTYPAWQAAQQNPIQVLRSE